MKGEGEGADDGRRERMEGGVSAPPLQTCLSSLSCVYAFRLPFKLPAPVSSEWPAFLLDEIDQQPGDTT